MLNSIINTKTSASGESSLSHITTRLQGVVNNLDTSTSGGSSKVDVTHTGLVGEPTNGIPSPVLTEQGSPLAYRSETTETIHTRYISI